MVVDGDNVTPCCASNGVTGVCLGICSGNIDNFPADVLDCESYIDTYGLCYNVFTQSTTPTPIITGNFLP